MILATSPLDGESRWLEVFPGEVSKAAAGCWLQGQHDIDLRHCMVIGNDYNDEAMLEWGVSPYVVANAPPALTARYPVVASNDDGGFADAVFDWLRREGLD